MKPPRDPFLRAVCLVLAKKDLTPTERLAMLALWRFLKDEKKPIGPTLLAYWLGTSYGMAKNHLTSLRRKGYIGSTGKRAKGSGYAAERWLTKKIKWPVLKRKGVPGGISKQVPGGITDLGVRQAGPPSAKSADPFIHPCRESGREVEIADLIVSKPRKEGV